MFKKIFLSLALFLLFPAIASASELYLGTAENNWQKGDSSEFVLYLSATENINAVEGKVVFPADVLSLKEIKIEDSVVNFWAEGPKEDQNGEIIFSGITPGGYKGEGRPVFKMIFEAKKSGGGSILVSNARVLKNDGKGTPAELKTSNFQFSVAEKPVAPSVNTKVRYEKYFIWGIISVVVLIAIFFVSKKTRGNEKNKS